MVDDAAGPLALGAKGSVRDRLTPPGRVEGSALGRYIVSLRWRGMALSAPFFMPPLAAKTFPTALRASEMHSPFGDWRHHLSPLFKRAQQPVLTVELLMKKVFRGVLFFPLNRGKSGAAG